MQGLSLAPTWTLSRESTCTAPTPQRQIGDRHNPPQKECKVEENQIQHLDEVLQKLFLV